MSQTFVDSFRLDKQNMRCGAVQREPDHRHPLLTNSEAQTNDESEERRAKDEGRTTNEVGANQRDKRTTERPNDRTTERPNDRTTERPNDRTTGRRWQRSLVMVMVMVKLTMTTKSASEDKEENEDEEGDGYVLS